MYLIYQEMEQSELACDPENIRFSERAVQNRIFKLASFAKYINKV